MHSHLCTQMSHKHEAMHVCKWDTHIHTQTVYAGILYAEPALAQRDWQRLVDWLGLAALVR